LCCTFVDTDMPKGPGRYLKSPYAYNPKPAVDSWRLVFESNEYDRDENKKNFIDSTNGASLSIKQMRLMTQQLGYGLRHRAGLQEREVVLIFCTNSLYYPPAMFSTQAGSLICTFANPTYTEGELEHLARDSNAKLIITQSGLMPVVEPVIKRMGLPKSRVFLLDPEDTYQDLKSIWSLSGKETMKPRPLSEAECRTTTAFRCYSSGTTGKAKGVETTHYNIGSVLQQYLDTAGERVTNDKIYLCFLPLYHMYGLFIFEYLGLYVGIQTIMMRKFEFEDFLKAVETYKVTNLTLVPPVVLALAKSPLTDKYDLSSVKEMGCGAAPLSQELYDQMKTKFGIDVLGGYGMTETTCIICTDKPESSRVGSCGKLIAGVEGFLQDDGELLVRGPNITYGYWANDNANKESWTEDGWMKTGDICTVDDDGYLYVTDRVKELIKYKGLQIAPAELEGVLLGRPDVLDVGVVPFYKADEATEVPRAYITLNDMSEASEAKANEIVAWTSKKLAPYKQLRGGVVFIDAVPKNPSGKILRRFLRDRKGDTPLGLGALTRSAKL